MAYAALSKAGVHADRQASAYTTGILWSEMLSTILDHFRDGRDAKILLPVQGGRSIAVEAAVRSTSEDALGIALPGDRDFSDIVDFGEICQVFFFLQGREYRLLTRIQSLVGPSDLLVTPKPPAIALQEREFFRIDTRIKLDYYCLAADQPHRPHSLQTKVNLSASGIRLPAPANVNVGDLLALVLRLDGKSFEIIDCLAQVVRFCSLPNGDPAVALHFAEIDNADRDKIVAFCLARERELLRTKVRTRDLF